MNADDPDIKNTETTRHCCDLHLIVSKLSDVLRFRGDMC